MSSLLNDDEFVSQKEETKMVHNIVFQTIKFLATTKLRGYTIINGRVVNDCVDVGLITRDEANQILKLINGV